MHTHCKILALTLMAFALAHADTEIVSIADGQAAGGHLGGKVQQICVLSSVASGTATPDAKYVAPGDEIFFDGTARGRVTVILTR